MHIINLNNKKMELLEQELQSTKAINQLKLRLIKKGGYAKNKSVLISDCEKHFNLFGVDLTPKHI